ncbi:MAG: hypothetical protein GX660_26155 [Clostridiaceae bacterium]|jgi:hypothetical protein|nr:hypothetical protein [Clostridiaceae bacterium]
MNKKILILVLIVVVSAVGIFLVFNNKSKEQNNDNDTIMNIDYTTITSDKLATTIQLKVPKNKGIVKNVKGGEQNEVEFVSEESGYRIAVFLYDQPYNSYELEKNLHKQSESFKEITINNFKGYEYNMGAQKIITLSLGQAPTGFHRIYSMYIHRKRNYDKPIDELMELEEIKTIVNSIKIKEDYII